MPYKDYEEQKKNARENYYKNKKKRLEQVKEYYYKNWEEKQKYRNDWLASHPLEVKKYKKKYMQSDKGKASVKKSIIKYFANPKNKQKHLAHYAISHQVRTGKIVKPDKCQDCKIVLKKHQVQGHHFMGYDKKYRLTVKWLCSSCHKKHESNTNVSIS